MTCWILSQPLSSRRTSAWNPRTGSSYLTHNSRVRTNNLALNVRLKPSEPLAHPKATNYTNVGIAQGIAYLDFKFIEPSVLAAMAKIARDGRNSLNKSIVMTGPIMRVVTHAERIRG
jgi:hypothetical protein